MTEFVLPSSPVWYQSRGCDSSPDGFFAFASRNLVYLLDVRKEHPVYHGILSGHEDRVTTCSFAQKASDAGMQLLSSSGDDSSVKIWNVHAMSLVNEQRVHGSNKVISVHWSPACWYLVVSGDEKGYIVAWNLEKDSTSKFFPDSTSQQQLSCVVCSPCHTNLVAVAYKSGAASIIDLDKRGSVLRKLRGHGNEIHTIIWLPFCHENIFESDETTALSSVQPPDQHTGRSDQQLIEGVIVTGSKDRTIRVWNLSKAKCLKIWKLPTRPSKGRRVNDETSRLYVALHWPKESRSKFLSSSFNGDILIWDASHSDNQQRQVLSSDLPDAGHQRIVFNMCSGFDANATVITTSMDRYIKCWSLTSPSSPPVWSLPTLGGYAYAISISPLDPSVVALGVGDGVIRIWKVKNPRNPYDLTMLWQGVKEKVMSLAWHPLKEGILAFGTEDGKVGVYDTLTQRPPIIAETYHLKPVYAMSWGPSCYPDNSDSKPSNNDLCLFSCGGEGIIRMHSLSRMTDEATNVNYVIDSTNERMGHKQARHSDVKWKSDFKVVAIGNDNGSFDIYQFPHLSHVTTVKVHNKIINCLSWCPVPEEHESFYWIASGSNGSTVCLSDVRGAVEKQSYQLTEVNAGEGPPPSRIITEPLRTLSGHTGRVTGLSWNANDPTQLASASYDGSAQVWNVQDESPLANYRGHDGRLLCVSWSPIMDDGMSSGLIYTGGDDYAVHVWRAEKQEHKTPRKDNPHVGYTQKQSAQWKRKNKKKKASTKQSSAHSSEAFSASHQTNAESATNRNETPRDSDIDALLEQKRAQLLAEMDTDLSMKSDRTGDLASSASESQCTQLNPNAEPFNSKLQSQSEQGTPDLDNAQLKHLLKDLSESRKFDSEAKDDQGVHGRRRRIKNLFPLSVSLDNRNKEAQQQDCITIAKLKSVSNRGNTTVTAEQANLGLYSDRRSAYRMFYQEEQKLAEGGSYDTSYILRTWRGDIVGAIEEATERGDLTDQLVAMAPLAGYDVWQQAAQSFAQQLTKEGLHLHASQYLIACHKIREAITLLRDGKHYREAVALARARLVDDDPLLLETVRLWANKLKTGGTFEMAAKCFASVGDYSKAAESLSLRANLKPNMDKDGLQALFTASAVARNGPILEEAFTYARRALSSVCLRTGSWKEAHEAAETCGEETAVYRLLLHTHELLIHYLTASGNSSIQDLFTDPSPFRESDDFTDISQFVDDLLKSWKGVFDVGNPKFVAMFFEQAEEFTSSSSELMSSASSRLTAKQIYYQIALHVTVAVLGTCCYDKEKTGSVAAVDRRSAQDSARDDTERTKRSKTTARFAVATNILQMGDADSCLIPLFEKLFASIAQLEREDSLGITRDCFDPADGNTAASAFGDPDEPGYISTDGVHSSC